MTYQAITYDLRNDIATITMNRPDVMNGLNTVMRREITDAVHKAAHDARVLVLTGAGRGFCSGQDLGDAKSITQVDLQRTLHDEYEPMLKAIYTCPIPTIAAVNGAAAGAGANLALATDVVIATRSAYFIQAFARIGLIPDAGGTYFLPRQIGFARAMGAALFTDKITAQQAADWGMIWECIDDDDFAAHVAERARHLAKGPTRTYGLIKQAMRVSLDHTLDQQLHHEAILQGQAGKTHDFAEGVSAFLEKRSPDYKGH